jgi:hypothetical protein
MGFYSASSATMSRFRESIDEDPDKFLKVISFYSEGKLFTLEGEKYKKIIDENKPEEIQDWYQRKNFYLVHNSQIQDRLFRKDFVDDLILGFRQTVPFYKYLWKIKSGS